MISVIIANSRGDKHPDWVQIAVRSVEEQSVKVELIVINNIGRKRTIGECWNLGVKDATGEYCFFLGDDDWITETYLSEVLHYAKKYSEHVMWTTNMTAFHNDSKTYVALTRICTGMWRREYLLKYPFNEKLNSGIDREYLEEMKKRGDTGFSLNTNFGYYYRKHSDYSCAADIKLVDVNDDIDMYVLTSSSNFLTPLVKEWKKDKKVFVSTEPFSPVFADKAKVIWCEWLRNASLDVATYDCKAKKILRIHAYEAFSELIYYTDFSDFDTVIFVAEHIKDFVESKVGKIPNAVVIPVGVRVNGYDPVKEQNNKIAYAGQISRKKGIGELFLIARELPEYEFHVAGKFVDEDVAQFFEEKKPDNITLEPFSYNLKEWLKDKTYIINTSLREGNPITVLEAMEVGLKPLVYDWIGAKEIYGKTYKNIKELKGLLNEPYEPSIYKEFVKTHFNFEDTFKKIESVINGNI